MQFRTAAIALVALVAGAVDQRPAMAEDTFYDLVISDLDLGGAKYPDLVAKSSGRGGWARAQQLDPYAVLNVPGEVYLELRSAEFGRPAFGRQRQIAIRTPANVEVKGLLFVPNADGSGLEPLPFSVPRSAAKPDAETNFYALKLAQLNWLVERRIPGGAWFRHQIVATRQAMGRQGAELVTNGAAALRPGRADELVDAFEYLTGGRAVSENLQLDRLLRVSDHAKAEEASVAVADLKGIAIAEIDWSKLTSGLEPKLDPLSAVIPADQHAMFFPSFDHFVRTIDEGMAGGTPVLEMTEPRSEDAMTLERYQRQLGLSLTGIGRLIGPKVVKSVALTGSDPFYREGTDMAILFETADPAALEKLLLAQIALAAANEKQARPVDGKVGNLQYRGLRTPDRRICSYVAALPGSVVVTNSTYPLERFSQCISARRKKEVVDRDENLVIAALPEYQFFRDRYRLGDADETAFLFVSDATLRRWCGPRWRIAESRRLHDLAVMAELQATYLPEVVKGESKPDPLKTDFLLASGGETKLAAGGVVSSVVGGLDFQTPIAEIPLTHVTPTEAEAYRIWREGYERNWRWAFDPIGLRIGLGPKQVSADLTIMPLIAGTQYRQILDVTQGAKIAASAGDRHAALAQLILAINLKSPLMQQASGMARTFAGNVNIDPLSWLGSAISVYLDDDPLWAKLAAIDPDDRQKFLEKNWQQTPLGINIEVANPLKLTGFLVALRAFIDQTSPNMLEWQTLEYRGRSYVKVMPAEQLRQQDELQVRDAAIYYAPSGTALIVTPSEAVLKRAIDRQIAKTAKEPPAKEPDAEAPAALPPPMGDNLAVHVDARLVAILAAIGGDQYQAARQQLAWSNLPILNEWHRLYPDVDPVALHERVWHTRLVCPGEGKYVWNEKFRTMESTVYGHPGEPKNGPAALPQLRQFTSGDFGLTFENHGLRARVMLERAKADGEKAGK